MDIRGHVVEVFSSIQGEGLHVGRRQVFVRLAGCSFGCRYCDQPEARKAPLAARFQCEPNSGRVEEAANPVTSAQVVRRAVALDSPAGSHHAFSITGGEPLEQADFLAGILQGLRSAARPAMLETNGVMCEEIEKVIDLVDIVSMDVKLASTTGLPTPFETHRRFLAAAVCKRVYVKAVIADGTTDEEIEALGELICSQSRTIPLVLQPVAEGQMEPPKPGRLLRMQSLLLRRLADVRVIAQMHKILGLP